MRHYEQEEARYRQLADALPQLVWTSNPEGVVDYYNSRAAQYAGLEQHTSNWVWQPVLHPADLAPTMAAWQAAQQSGTYEFEHRLQMRDGSYRWHLSRAYALRNDAGQISKWFGTATDIHERKQAEEDALLFVELSELIRLGDNINTLLSAALALVGQYMQVRRCYIAEVDHARQRWIVEHEYVHNARSLVGTHSLADYPAELIARAQRGQINVCADTSVDPHVKPHYEASFAPLGVRAYLVVPLLREGLWIANMNIDTDTPRQWQPREVRLLETLAERLWLAVERLRLEQQRTQAEAEIARLLVEEQAARKLAETASHLKDEFLATLSHELRTPLTALLGYLHMLQSHKRSEAEIERLVASITRSAKSQVHLVEDLLDVSRIVTGKMRIEPSLVDMTEVVQHAIEAVRLTFEAKALHLQTLFSPEPCLLFGDPARLQQVVWNLLSNAAKFTPPAGTVRIELQTVDKQIQLTVSDNGQGISAEFLPHVFERFRQADSSSSRLVGGLGLGLAIVRHLVEMHGGMVEAQSAGIGQGATFIVRLPIRNPSETSFPVTIP
jgi:PAS domain S-box-containing protein